MASKINYASRLLLLGLSIFSGLFAHANDVTQICESNLTAKTEAQAAPATLHRLDGDVELQKNGFIDEWLGEFQSSRVYYPGGRINGKINGRVFMIHGAGAMSSSANGVQSFLRYFSNAEENVKASSVTAKVRNLPDFMLMGAEALNLPGSWRSGRSVDDFPTMDSVADYIAHYLMKMKAETPELPLIVVAKSMGGAMAENIVRRYPGLVDGLVLTSPTCPNTRTYRAAVDILKHEEELGLIKINWPVLNWAMRLLDNSEFVDDTFSKVPTLIMTGARDGEISNEERAYYRNLASKYDTVQYVDIPEASHDMSREDTDHKKMGLPRTYFEPNVVSAMGLIETHFKKVVEEFRAHKKREQ